MARKVHLSNEGPVTLREFSVIVNDAKQTVEVGPDSTVEVIGFAVNNEDGAPHEKARIFARFGDIAKLELK